MKTINIKKKAVLFLLLAALLLPAFAACRKESGNIKHTDALAETTVSQEQTSPPPVNTSAVTSVTTPPQTGPDTPPLPPNIEFSLSDGRDDLWELHFSEEGFKEDMMISSGAIHGDKLLITSCVYITDEDKTDEFGDPYWESDWFIELIDLRKGRTGGRFKVDGDVNQAGFLEDGSIYMAVLSEESNYEEIDLYHFNEPSDRMQKVISIDWQGYSQVGEDGIVWTYNRDDHVLQGLTPFDDRPDYRFSLSDWSSVWYCGSYNGSVFVRCYDESWTPSFVEIRMSDGTEISYPQSYLRNANYVYNDLIVFNSSEEWMIAFPEDLFRVNVFPKRSESSYPHIAAGPYLAECEYTDGSYGVYDARSGAELGRLFETENMQGLNAICMDEKGTMVLYCYGEDGVPRIILWKYNAGEPVSCENLRVIDLRESSAENSRMVREIYDRYGIRVFYDELSLIDLVWDYTCQYVDDEYTITAALKKLSAALAKYPEGMFDEMLTENYGALELYLCGYFTPTGESGISNAGALTSTRYDALIMAFNVYYIDMLEQNLSHELMHVMEYHIEKYCEENGIPYQSEWQALNPPGFVYYDSYHDKNGYEIYDPSYTMWEGYEKAWFVDPYSKSFATEDRARVFENLFVGNEYVFESPYLREKAEYLCALIRKSFESVQSSQGAAWERLYSQEAA